MSDGDSEKDNGNAASLRKDYAAAQGHEEAIKNAGSVAAESSEKAKGDAAFRRGDFAAALKHYDTAIENAGNGAGAVLFANKAATLTKLEKYDACVEQCRKGLAAPGLTPDLKSKIYLRMGSAFEAQGKFMEAFKTYTQCDDDYLTDAIVNKVSALAPQLVKAGDTKAMEDFCEFGHRILELSGRSVKPTRAGLMKEHNRLVEQFEKLPGNGKEVAPVRFSGSSAASGHLCVARLSDLEPISVDQLRMRKVYVGKVLVCRIIAEPAMRKFALTTLVEDPNGGVARIDVYNFCSPGDDLNYFLPMGLCLAVKEPWYKEGDGDGNSFVCVENRTDLVYLEQTHPLLKDIVWRTQGPSPGVLGLSSWDSLQKRGNELFVAGSYELAVVAYTGAIEMKREVAPKKLADLFSNRAAALLGDGRPAEALPDCYSALELEPGHLKAAFRLAKARAKLGQYEEAKKILEKSPHATRPEFQTEISRLNILLREQQYGDYDLKSLMREAAKTPRIDHADYNGGVRREWILSERGNGLIAQRDFAPGDLLFVNKAFEATFNYECGVRYCVKAGEVLSNYSSNEWIGRFLRRVSKDPDCVRDLLPLYAGPTLERFDDGANGSGVPLDDTRLAYIMDYNRFGDCGENADDDGTREGASFDFGGFGIWILASALNHSCAPNTCILYVGDLMFVRAAKAIVRGEELTTSYIDPWSGYVKRQADLKKYGFTCECERCLHDTKHPSSEQYDLDSFEGKFAKLTENLDEGIPDVKLACLFYSGLADQALRGREVDKAKKYFSKARQAAVVALGSDDRELLAMFYPRLPMKQLFKRLS